MNDHTPESAPLQQSDDFKRCPKCTLYKPRTPEYFVRSKARRDGYHPHCKVCLKHYRDDNAKKIAEARRGYFAAYREANKEKIDAYNAEYRARNKEAIAERNRRWRRVNWPEILERSRKNRQAYNARNKERIRVYRAKYRAANKDRHVIYQQRREARKRAAIGDHGAVDIKRQYEAQRGKCYYCHVKVGKVYNIEHVIPLSRGGSNGPENIVIACPSCNASKKNKMPHEWPQGNRLL